MIRFSSRLTPVSPSYKSTRLRAQRGILSPHPSLQEQVRERPSARLQRLDGREGVDDIAQRGHLDQEDPGGGAGGSEGPQPVPERLAGRGGGGLPSALQDEVHHHGEGGLRRPIGEGGEARARLQQVALCLG